MTDLADMISLPSSKGRRAADLDLEVVRELTAEDLPKLESSEGFGLSAPPLTKLRHSHHQLAQLLARGVENAEAALITGYGVSYISILKKDASFRELVTFYTSERDAIFVETLERMRSLGLSTLDELQARLEEDAKSWTKRELMELAELCLVKPQATRQQGASGGAVAVNVEIKFVEPPQAAAPDVEVDVVDLEFEDVSRG